MAQVDVTIKKTKIKTGFLFIIPLYRILQKCSKTSEQFLLIGRWLPNTKKKKSVSVPRCPRCDM